MTTFTVEDWDGRLIAEAHGLANARFAAKTLARELEVEQGDPLFILVDGYQLETWRLNESGHVVGTYTDASRQYEREATLA